MDHQSLLDLFWNNFYEKLDQSHLTKESQKMNIDHHEVMLLLREKSPRI